jgi:hypothetical protein
MYVPVVLQGTPIIWVWQAMWLLFACYCFGLAIYRKAQLWQQGLTERKQHDEH